MPKKASAAALAGQLMLQISAGRFFRPGVPLNERLHRRVIYSNAWFPLHDSIDLPVGKYLPSSDLLPVCGGTLEAMDRLEAKNEDGSTATLIATSGDDLIDDVAYVMTMALNRTFMRDHDVANRLIASTASEPRRRGAQSLFPHLFDPSSVVQPEALDDLTAFITKLISLHREDFARIMRVIRATVDATRRAIDDPTGAYTDMVAALESLGERSLTGDVSWERFDGRKRKLIDAALQDADTSVAERVRQAVMEADHAGAKQTFVSSTLSRIGPSYYRDDAVGAVQAPREVDMQKMLSVAYNIRSRRSHVLQDLGTEAWVFTEGAETAYEHRHEHVLTLAGLWRLARHVVSQYVATCPATDPTPWNYRLALPGIAYAQWAPQYWVGNTDGLSVQRAGAVLDGVVRVLIELGAKRTNEATDLSAVCEKIESLVPSMTSGVARTALVCIYRLWHEICGSRLQRPNADAFLQAYRNDLEEPSVASLAVQVLTTHRPRPWTVEQWAALANARHVERATGKGQPMPPGIDAVLQLWAADELEQAGRHEEAVRLASRAVGEVPGHPKLIEWERALVEGPHDPTFDIQLFLFDRTSRDDDEQGADDTAGGQPSQ